MSDTKLHTALETTESESDLETSFIFEGRKITLTADGEVVGMEEFMDASETSDLIESSAKSKETASVTRYINRGKFNLDEFNSLISAHKQEISLPLEKLLQILQSGLFSEGYRYEINILKRFTKALEGDDISPSEIVSVYSALAYLIRNDSFVSDIKKMLPELYMLMSNISFIMNQINFSSIDIFIEDQILGDLNSNYLHKYCIALANRMPNSSDPQFQRLKEQLLRKYEPLFSGRFRFLDGLKLLLDFSTDLEENYNLEEFANKKNDAETTSILLEAYEDLGGKLYEAMKVKISAIANKIGINGWGIRINNLNIKRVSKEQFETLFAFYLRDNLAEIQQRLMVYKVKKPEDLLSGILEVVDFNRFFEILANFDFKSSVGNEKGKDKSFESAYEAAKRNSKNTDHISNIADRASVQDSITNEFLKIVSSKLIRLVDINHTRENVLSLRNEIKVELSKYGRILASLIEKDPKIDDFPRLRKEALQFLTETDFEELDARIDEAFANVDLVVAHTSELYNFKLQMLEIVIHHLYKHLAFNGQYDFEFDSILSMNLNYYTKNLTFHFENIQSLESDMLTMLQMFEHPKEYGQSLIMRPTYELVTAIGYAPNSVGNIDLSYYKYAETLKSIIKELALKFNTGEVDEETYPAEFVKLLLASSDGRFREALEKCKVEGAITLEEKTAKLIEFTRTHYTFKDLTIKLKTFGVKDKGDKEKEKLFADLKLIAEDFKVEAA